jgi:uncharacterized protein YciI
MIERILPVEVTMRRTFLVAAVLAGLALTATVAQQETEMTTYQLVLLHRAAGARPMGEREIQRLQEEHLAYLERLHGEHRLIIEGPLDSTGQLRGVMVLDVGSVEEAEAIMAEDAWVKAGRLEAEIHPWWTAKGIVQETDEFLYQETCYLGLLLRPESAPEYSEEKLQEIQAGHLSNIRKMADSGDLVLAGPMGDDGRLRGILVFRATDPERITTGVAEDPAIQAGRLEMELYPWNVPRGSLPPP